MSDNTEKEDNINSLCKKYFTPELCDEPVTESKAALKYKLERQLVLFSKYLWGQTKYKNLELPIYVLESADRTSQKSYNAVLEEATGIAIGILFEKCKREKKDSYSAFYCRVFLNELNTLVNKEINIYSFVPEKVKEDDKELSKQCKKFGIESDNFEKIKKVALEIGLSDEDLENVLLWRKNKNPIQIETPGSNDEEKGKINDFKEDRINVENNAVQILDAEEKFELIEKCFRMKKRGEWHKALITQRLYADLHQFFSYKPEISLKHFSFIDRNIYNLQEAPSQEDLAKYLNKDSAQLTRKWNDYVVLFQESFYKQLNTK